MKNLISSSCVLATSLLFPPAHAGIFDSGLPANWTCTGSCGTAGADGVVPFSPAGGSAYGWISSYGSAHQAGLPGAGGMNGSALRSGAFSADAGMALDFHFNFVTSDGGGFADYAWARLLDGGGLEVAVLFTARTNVNGDAVPGFALPLPVATLTPFPVPITPDGTSWAPLGSSSNACFSLGCGHTGWVRSQYTIANDGIYQLEFGVSNWDDTIFDSGLAFDAIKLGGVPLPIPEPGQYAMLLAGLALLTRRARAWL